MDRGSCRGAGERGPLSDDIILKVSCRIDEIEERSAAENERDRPWLWSTWV